MGSRAGSMRAGRSNTFKGLYAPRICLGVSRASTPKYSSASAVLRAQHLETQMGGAPATVASLAGGAAARTPGRAQRARAGGRAWMALELRSGRARAALGLRLELFEEELARRARRTAAATTATTIPTTDAAVAHAPAPTSAPAPAPAPAPPPPPPPPAADPTSRWCRARARGRRAARAAPCSAAPGAAPGTVPEGRSRVYSGGRRLHLPPPPHQFHFQNSNFPPILEKCYPEADGCSAACSFLLHRKSTSAGHWPPSRRASAREELRRTSYEKWRKDG